MPKHGPRLNVFRLFPRHIKYSLLNFNLICCQQWFLKILLPGHRACLVAQQLVKQEKMYVMISFVILHLKGIFGGVGVCRKGLLPPIQVLY